ncbi:hypothetical protein [Labilibaculum antarcticum]|nr:hypothetical protein [Labilibaculum antarcticum]
MYTHPGLKDSALIKYSLFETPDKEFYLNVPSVYCADDICKIDTVKIFWNDIGSYQRFELKPDVHLEKAKGELFTAHDYKKLHLILKDENSPFKTVHIDNIVSTQNEQNGAVDIHSSATVLDIDESTYVKGAVLTCFTLWHWANGQLQEIIKKITGDSANNQDFTDYLNHGDIAHKLFTIKLLISRKDYEPQLLNLVKEQYKLESSSVKRSVISYLENAPEEIYCRSILDLFNSDDSEQRVACLQSLVHSKANLTPDFYRKIYGQLSNLKTYHEVDLLLTLLDKNDQNSEEIIKPLFSLLTHSNILISRRVFWFLGNQKLDKKQAEILERFSKKNSEYL